MNSKPKKILLLGGLRYLLPVIEAAHKLGIYVITCDYIPDNIAHKYSDEYHNVSIVDKDAVLTLAKELSIDGIMSFAVDPGVTTAAYVAEQMGLPHSGSFESVSILQNKAEFRHFLEINGFNVPRSRGYDNYLNALKDKDYFDWPVIVKPVDSAGSKGVTRVDEVSNLESAINHAIDNSMSKQFIIEEFIEKDGCSSDSDCFSVDGHLKFVSFSAQHFDENASNKYAPAAYSWPSTMSKVHEYELTSEIQRLLTLLKLRTSIYNVETRIGKNGKPYIMEVSPRGGGNRLAEMLRNATGVDMITNAVRAAVGMEIVGVEQKPYNGHWAEIILHANKCGIFRGLELNTNFPGEIIERDIWVKQGDKVDVFEGANNAIGTLILKFKNHDEMERSISNPARWLNISINYKI